MTEKPDLGQSEVDRLRAALAFYADHRNHRGVGTSRIYNDRGREARMALGPCSTCNLYGDGQGWVKTGRTLGDQDGPYDETKVCPDCHGAGVPGVRP